MSKDAVEQKLPLMTLTAMVVVGMVGAGVFSIPRNFAQATGIYGALIAWAIAGAGMLMLGLVFQTLANRKPDLVYAYAGPALGLTSASSLPSATGRARLCRQRLVLDPH